MKILNLYAGIGGNRKLWGDKHEITAVEINEQVAEVYKSYFPNDIVIVGDANSYLLENFKEYDFIWSSPPCPTHSRANFWGSKTVDTRNKVYPDMKLYQEILFLDNWYEGRYVVENVIPYYKPLIPAKEKDRHLYWTNFNLPNSLNSRHFTGLCQTGGELGKLEDFHQINLSGYKGSQKKIKIARNLVDYEAGKTILETALGIIRKENDKQLEIF